MLVIDHLCDEIYDGSVIADVQVVLPCLFCCHIVKLEALRVQSFKECLHLGNADQVKVQHASWEKLAFLDVLENAPNRVSLSSTSPSMEADHAAALGVQDL